MSDSALNASGTTDTGKSAANRSGGSSPKRAGDLPPGRRDLVTALISTWLVLAVFSDGWAHFNVPELESFFTPWHLAMYTGFAAMAVWVAWLGWRRHSANTPPLDWVPYGYRAAVLGLVVFGVGGVADLAWHEIFGIEIAVDALVSPSHLLLGAGGLLILSSPIRAQRVLARRGQGAAARWTVPTLLSLVLTTALVAFFLLYTSPFASPTPVVPFVPTPEGSPGHLEAELPVIASLAGYLVASVMLAVPLLLMHRSRAGIPAGGVTLLVTTIAWLSVAVMDFPAVAVGGAVGATLGAVVADLALPAIRRRLRGRRALPSVLAGGSVTLVWAGQLAGLAVVEGIGWPVSLWLGVIVLGGFTAAALGLLAEE